MKQAIYAAQQVLSTRRHASEKADERGTANHESAATVLTKMSVIGSHPEGINGRVISGRHLMLRGHSRRLLRLVAAWK